MTITASHAPTPGAETAARARVAELRSVLAEDRTTRHEGVIVLSSGRQALGDPPPIALRPVNSHPGPDFDAGPEAA